MQINKKRVFMYYLSDVNCEEIVKRWWRFIVRHPVTRSPLAQANLLSLSLQLELRSDRVSNPT